MLPVTILITSDELINSLKNTFSLALTGSCLTSYSTDLEEFYRNCGGYEGRKEKLSECSNTIWV